MFGPAGIFFKGFVKHPVMVGAIVPSSRRTIARVLSKVDWERCDLFVEYGPGVGTFCQPVLDRVRRDVPIIDPLARPLVRACGGRDTADGVHHLLALDAVFPGRFRAMPDLVNALTDHVNFWMTDRA